MYKCHELKNYLKRGAWFSGLPIIKILLHAYRFLVQKNILDILLKNWVNPNTRVNTQSRTDPNLKQRKVTQLTKCGNLNQGSNADKVT